MYKHITCCTVKNCVILFLSFALAWRVMVTTESLSCLWVLLVGWVLCIVTPPLYFNQKGEEEE